MKLSKYGIEFDQTVSAWATLENEHDQIHPDRSKCGGVGACSMMLRAHQRQTDLMDLLDEWRKA